MNPWEVQEALLMAQYGLQACDNLLPVFLAAADRESVAYFQGRRRHYLREIQKLEGGK